MANEGMDESNTASWDKNTQTYHGGQEWSSIGNFVDDFSVTTNFLGTPAPALAAAREAVGSIHHYPPADFEPARTDLARFIWPAAEETAANHPALLLGNGASELIDLVVRSSPRGNWRPGGTQTQYKEYERSCRADGRDTSAPEDTSAPLLCLVNPTNPTGDYMDVEATKAYLEANTQPDQAVIVDESMQIWLGPHWREDSLLHQREWVRRQWEERRVAVYVMVSWTKIWSCTGVRLGSVCAPTPELAAEIKRKQVPWSVNSMALAFLSNVVQDDAYLQRTWAETPVLRSNCLAHIHRLFPAWTVANEQNNYLSWVWVDTHDEALAEQLVAAAKAAGCPVRWGKPGYNLPSHIRIAVRAEEPTAALFAAWEPLSSA